MEADFSVELVRWATHSAELSTVRFQVFVVEQNVPYEIEIDEYDPLAIHALARDSEGSPIGTGRLLDDGKIGRVAVLREWRGKNAGTGLMSALIGEARSRGLSAVHLHAQTRSLPFYVNLGFTALGSEFAEADIPHLAMTLELRK